MELELRINGIIKSLAVAPGDSLLTMLSRAGYVRVKTGCQSGQCGARPVLVAGRPRLVCVMPPLPAACPLAMIPLMRGMGGMGNGQSATQPAQTSQPARVVGTPEEQLAELKARHEAIAAEIAQLESANDTPRTQELATVATHRMSAN